MPRKKPAAKAEKSTKRPARNVDKPSAKATARVMVPQPHGGALVPGAGGGRENGLKGGRPPQMVRALLANEAIQGVSTLRQILAGEPVKEARIPLAAVLRYATCPECDGRLTLRSEMEGHPIATISITGVESASPGDRVRAFDAFAKYGIGTKDEVTVISPDIRARVERTVALIAGQPSWDSEALLKQLDPIWSAE